MAFVEFLQHVEDEYCGLHQTTETINQLYDAALVITKQVVNRIGELNPFLRIKELKSVGSFAEGTKIRAPNEFDFLACLDFLSHEDNIWIESQEGCTPGYMIVFLKNPKSAMDLFRMRLYSDICCVQDVGLRQTFIEHMTEAVKSFLNFGFITKYGELVLTGSSFLTLHLEWKHFGKTCNGDIVNKGFGKHNIPFSSTAYTLTVDIDIMPAIEIGDSTLPCSIEGFPDKFTDVIKTKGCHLICKPAANEKHSPYLQVSFATSEVALMQNLHHIHKRCYKILKYLLTDNTNINNPMKCIHLSSYMIKTALLFHEYEHGCGSPNLPQCILAIINYIRQNFRKGIMPSFFMRNVNVWGRVYRLPIWWHRQLTGLKDGSNCFRGEWSLILWMELWHQVLNKAFFIFQEICTANRRNYVYVARFKGQEEKHSETGTKVDETTIILNEHPTRQESTGPINVPGTQLNEYIPTWQDMFLEDFQELRQTMVDIVKNFVRHATIEQLTIKSPKPEVWDLVLPKFVEYLSQIEKANKTIINLPRVNLINLELVEVIYSR